MSFGWKTPQQRPGEMIPAHALNKIYEAVGNLLRLTVGRGLSLSWVRGAPSIQLDGDFSIYDVITTSAWTARSTTHMGTGKFKFQDATLAGVLSDSGLPEFDGFNFTGGTVPTSCRGLVARVNGTWRLIAADCSGVA